VRQTFRNPVYYWVLALATLGCAFGARRVGTVGGAVLFAAAWVICAVVLLRPRLIATDSGVTIVNYLSTHRLAWPQVARFEVHTWQGRPVVVARKADGDKIRIWSCYTWAPAIGTNYPTSARDELEHRRLAADRGALSQHVPAVFRAAGVNLPSSPRSRL
jgi:hypothetical protein